MARSRPHSIIPQEHAPPLYELYKLMELRKLASRAFSPLGLTLPDAMLLIYVSDGINEPQELMALMNVHASALAAMATRAVEKKLLERHKSREDYRRVSYGLTNKGKKLVEASKEAWLSEYRGSPTE